MIHLLNWKIAVSAYKIHDPRVFSQAYQDILCSEIPKT